MAGADVQKEGQATAVSPSEEISIVFLFKEKENAKPNCLANP